MKRGMLTALMILLPFVGAAAQEQKQETPKREPQPAAQAPREAGQAVNIRVELTITEQTGAATPVVKTISIMSADNHSGRIRSVNPTGASRGSELNADVLPRLLQNDRLRLAMSLEYRPVAFEVKQGEPDRPSLSESLTVILQDGKPLVVSQSADPNSDRKVRLEVKATILR